MTSHGIGDDDEMILNGYVRTLWNEYQIHIPIDIRSLLMLFYDTEILHLIRKSKEHFVIDVSLLLKNSTRIFP